LNTSRSFNGGVKIVGGDPLIFLPTSVPAAATHLPTLADVGHPSANITALRQLIADDGNLKKLASGASHRWRGQEARK
jgi:hypothetical protein